jgi:hypothetical protein
MRCYLIMMIWFNLFQIDSSKLTIWNSYALHNCGMRKKIRYMENNGGIMIKGREGGSYDRGKSGLLMFH